jgi:hypothetical protein
MLNQKITFREAFTYSIGGLLLLLFLWAFTQSATWAKLISPFDSKPEISIYEITKNPEKVKKYKIELCSWSKRELLRNPGFLTESASKAACKDIK